MAWKRGARRREVLVLVFLLAFSAGWAANVEFRVEAPDAHDVRIVGSFNYWGRPYYLTGPDETGIWSVGFSLDAGRYAYKVQVDGLLYEDPYAPDSEADGSGGRNSVVVVAGENLQLGPGGRDARSGGPFVGGWLSGPAGPARVTFRCCTYSKSGCALLGIHPWNPVSMSPPNNAWISSVTLSLGPGVYRHSLGKHWFILPVSRDQRAILLPVVDVDGICGGDKGPVPPGYGPAPPDPREAFFVNKPGPPTEGIGRNLWQEEIENLKQGSSKDINRGASSEQNQPTGPAQATQPQKSGFVPLGGEFGSVSSVPAELPSQLLGEWYGVPVDYAVRAGNSFNLGLKFCILRGRWNGLVVFSGNDGEVREEYIVKDVRFDGYRVTIPTGYPYTEGLMLSLREGRELGGVLHLGSGRSYQVRLSRNPPRCLEGEFGEIRLVYPWEGDYKDTTKPACNVGILLPANRLNTRPCPD